MSTRMPVVFSGHGTWTVLVHMFPKADIPVVQLSVNGRLSAAQSYAIGKKLTALRDEGYLIFGSGSFSSPPLLPWRDGGKSGKGLQQYLQSGIYGNDRLFI